MKKINLRQHARVIAPYALTVLVTAGAIYLTPLKWVTVVEPTIRDIDPVEFYALYKQDPDKYLFLDVRSEASFEAVHAVGSINAPLHTLYDLRHTLPKSGKKIVLICSGGRAAGVGYSYLEHYGFFNLMRVDGGIEAWSAAGLPIEGTEVRTKVTAFGQTDLCRV